MAVLSIISNISVIVGEIWGNWKNGTQIWNTSVTNTTVTMEQNHSIDTHNYTEYCYDNHLTQSGLDDTHILRSKHSYAHEVAKSIGMVLKAAGSPHIVIIYTGKITHNFMYIYIYNSMKSELTNSLRLHVVPHQGTKTIEK